MVGFYAANFSRLVTKTTYDRYRAADIASRYAQDLGSETFFLIRFEGNIQSIRPLAQDPQMKGLIR